MTEAQVARIKKDYPVGTKIELIEMEGEHDFPSGLIGTVRVVDDMGQLHMKWENGRSLALIPGVDKFKVVD